jgi:uncharacterized membrane protein YoaK (UPF0700 family)
MISATCGLVDSVCFLALGGVFAEMMTGNLLLMALSIGTAKPAGESARFIPAIVAFSLGALLGGRLLRGPQKMQERRIGFAVEWILIVAATALTWAANPTRTIWLAMWLSPCWRWRWASRTPWCVCTVCRTSRPM